MCERQVDQETSNHSHFDDTQLITCYMSVPYIINTECSLLGLHFDTVT